MTDSVAFCDGDDAAFARLYADGVVVVRELLAPEAGRTVRLYGGEPFRVQSGAAQLPINWPSRPDMPPAALAKWLARATGCKRALTSWDRFNRAVSELQARGESLRAAARVRMEEESARSAVLYGR